MSSYSPQLDNNQKPNKNIDHVFLLIFIALNGISTGQLIRTGRHIIDNGADGNHLVAALLSLGCTIYTAQRAIELYKKIYNDKDKQK